MTRFFLILRLFSASFFSVSHMRERKLLFERFEGYETHDMWVMMADVWIMSVDYEGGHVNRVYEDVWIMRTISEGAHYFRNSEQWKLITIVWIDPECSWSFTVEYTSWILGVQNKPTNKVFRKLRHSEEDNELLSSRIEKIRDEKFAILAEMMKNMEITRNLVGKWSEAL